MNVLELEPRRTIVCRLEVEKVNLRRLHDDPNDRPESEQCRRQQAQLSYCERVNSAPKTSDAIQKKSDGTNTRHANILIIQDPTERRKLSIERFGQRPEKSRPDKLLGQKPTLKLKEVQAIRIRLQLAGRLRAIQEIPKPRMRLRQSPAWP
mgnify:CR=1 FL=1